MTGEGPHADPHDPAETQIYDRRFPTSEAQQRDAIWREIVAYLQRYIPVGSRILDIGAGDGEFISNVVAAERWASDIRDTSERLPSDVHFVASEGHALAEVLELAYFDRVFMSNYLEHMESSAAVIEQLRVARELLKPGGQAIILQPNISLIGGAYWDFIDHKVALNDRSLAEAVELAGLAPVSTIKRFLPYTTKSRIPTSAGLVRAYLRFRPIWYLMGKQTLMIAERPMAADSAPGTTG